MVIKIKKILWKKKVKKKQQRTSALEKCPQKRGVCKKVYFDSPKKPNSAKRRLVRLILSTRRLVSVYVPGETSNLQNFSSVLIRGGRVQDMPGINYKVIRGKYDCHCLLARQQGRSKVGTKATKNISIAMTR